MFASSFWTHDYLSGVNVLFDKLKQGVSENSQVIALIIGRVRVERNFATELGQLNQSATPAPHQGFDKDAGALLRQSFEAYLAETTNRAMLHSRVAENLDKKVREPLEKWCKGHAKRINECEVHLKTKISGYNRLLQQVNKARQVYYERSREQEDVADTKFEPVASTIRIFREKYVSSPLVPSDPPGIYVMAGLEYTRDQLANLLTQLIKNVTIQEYRVPILGPYENVSSGVSIASSIRRFLKNDSIAYAEKFGQALVDQGFLKPVGQISNRFQSLHSSYFQWQDAAFLLAEEAEDAHSPSSPPSTGELSISRQRKRRSTPERGTGSLQQAGSPNLTHEGEHYLQLVLELDLYRCDMEIEIANIYEYLEKCETDRILAIKHALADFAAFSEKPEQHRDIQARLINSESSIDPQKDTEYIVDIYQTGPLVPSVTVYQGYSDSYCQTFGVDLKHSGFLVPLILGYLESEEVPLDAWTKPYKLSEVHKLRNQINNGKEFKQDILKFFPVNVVSGVLKQFLLELPESVLPFTIYDMVKLIYENGESAQESQNLVSVLLHVPKPSIKALQAFLDYLSAKYPDSSVELADALALHLFRPRAMSALSQQNTHPRMFIKDLLDRDKNIIGATQTRAADLSQQRSSTPVGLVTPNRMRNPSTMSPSSAHSFSPKRDNLPSLIPLSLDPEKQSSLIRSRGIDVTKGLDVMGQRSHSASPIKDAP